MCGRISQRRTPEDYVRALGWNSADGLDLGTGPAYNIPPGTTPLLMHRLPEGGHHVDRLHWGYRPPWAAERGIPLAINARLEKAASGRFFSPLWRAGRVIVPADGWYEWTGNPGHKQAWYIRLVDDGPMFLAGLASFHGGRQAGPGSSGFAIVTAAADAGMVDVHDRRPVVFSASDAQLWLDPSLSVEHAQQLARNMSQPSEAFRWHAVSKRVNKAGNEGPDLIEPITLPTAQPPVPVDPPGSTGSLF